MKKTKMLNCLLVIIFLSIFLISCSKTKMQQVNINANIIPTDITFYENNLYFFADDYDKNGNLISPQLYSIDKSNFNIMKFTNLSFSKSLKPVAIAMGADKQIYSIIRNDVETLQYEIWKISTTGIVEEKYNISKYIDENIHEGIKQFLLDSTGNFYIRECITDEIIVLNSQGNEINRIKDRCHEMSFESMSRNYKGNIYALFCMDRSFGGGYTIYTYLNGEQIEEYYNEKLLPYNDIYSVMGYGSKNNLIFKGMSGVYDYSVNKKKIKKNIELSLDKYSYTKSCFDDNGDLYIFAIYKTQNFETTGNVELLKYEF